MGGKSSGAPAPDPRLIEAQIRSMGVQDEGIQAILRTSREMAPLQREQMQFGLDSARTAYGQSQEDRQFMLGRRGQLSGLQDQLVADAQGFNSEERREKMAGEAIGDVNQAFSSAREQQVRGLSRMGVNPSSGRFAAMSNQMSMAQAAAQANAANKVRTAARAEGFALTDRANNALAGYPAMGMQATGAGAGFGAAGLTLANQGLAGMNSGFGAAGGLAGQMGSNATGMFNAQAQYKIGADRQAADNDPFAALLGAGAQLGAAKLMAGSDRRIKKDIEQVGVDERTGLPLYHFRYINGGGTLFKGVMAQDVLQVRPEAVFTMPDGFMAVDYWMLGLAMTVVQGETA